ncbi:FAD-dependent oxidoreductase [Parapedobacter tibetensis]|uniref:FAD-dependent oxidoreductase n=1 Tax=Parapedobacter tibetensis TaxID=2972951 RepID=UPI00214D3883|nr:FAD-dependent oxidoreductase [Parapedobacter tibetensis]
MKKYANYFLVLLITCFSWLTGCEVGKTSYDICVYGATASGVMAAIQAARMDKSVLLISDTDHVGGVATSGLTATDINRNTLIGGIAREFYQHIYAYYERPEAWRNQDRESFFVSSLKRTFTGKNDSLSMQWVYESHVAEEIMKEMLEKAGVTVVYNERLDLEKGVEKEGQQIARIRTEQGSSYAAKRFIDASYEGDLMKLANISYVIGREANSTYGEFHNGIVLNEVIGNGEQSVDPYIIKGDSSSGLLPFVDAQLWGSEGEADKRTQAFCYRMTLTNDPENRVPIEKPAGYNPLWHEVLARFLELNPDKQLQQIITLTPMPNKKTDTNHLDFFGASFDYPEGDYATREEIAQRHRDYALGMLWFLGNDERVPEHIRTEMAAWGLPKDEFADNDHFPYQLYVRESRRMIGEYIMTEHNCLLANRVAASDPVAVGTYMLDCHIVSRVVDAEGKLRNEGSVYGRGLRTGPYQISYQSITPKAEECENLLVPICLSASHIAFSSIRMEPVYMVLGQSAGTAAALSLDEQCTVQELDYGKLRAKLLQDGQIITVPDVK